MGNANSQMLENIVQGSNCKSALAGELLLQPVAQGTHLSKRALR